MGETGKECNFVLITAILLVSILNSIKSDPIVDMELGKIHGTILTSDNGKPFYAFRGIPYAKPPVKHLRFMPPVPVDKWQDSLDATENGHACIQVDMFRNNLITGDEDCLYLNVYTKELTKTSLRPVIFFIHGGGFYFGDGSSDMYGPERLLDKDIVLITFNYRLSALGFMSTEDEESPGNYGLLDQVEALKWVQNHVDSFGGDPKSVTIFGESAGSASVIFHLISPLSKGLFHGAIAHSGSAVSKWALNPKPMKQAKLLAEALKCPTDNSKDLVNCLRKRAALDIMTKSSIDNSGELQTKFRPVIDKDFGGSVKFLSENARSLLEKHQFNKVPVMIGNVKDEGYLFLLMYSMKAGKPENLVKNDLIKLHLKFNNLLEDESVGKLATGYLNHADLSDPHQKIRTFSNMIGDSFINADTDMTLKIIAASGVPTYAFKLTYAGENSIGSKLATLCKEDYAKTLKLVTHLDDLQYLFRLGILPNNLKEQDKLMADKMVTLWTNFAKNKVPSLNGSNADNQSFEWNPIQPNQQIQYLNIGDKFRMEEGPLSSRPDLWKKYQRKDEL